MDMQLKNSPYLLACKNQPAPRVPIWLMRQAGRYMECYRKLRQQRDFLTLVKTPELACEITLQPVKEFMPDAAIIFADILPLLDAMGLGLQFTKEDGPVIVNAIDSDKSIDNLRQINSFEDLSYTLEAIRLTKSELKRHQTPLIGFSGAPFTLASYAVEGGSSRAFIKTLSLMHNRPDLWHRLMQKMSDAIIDYLLAQVESGVDALQLFDSWVGVLSPYEYEIFVLPYVCNIVESVGRCDAPITYFSTQTSGYIDVLNKIPCDVLSVDWRIDIAQAFQRKSPRHALQGNLSPNVLLGNEASVRKQVRHLFESLAHVAPSFQGYIFNLGHGIHKETPVGNVQALFDEIRAIKIAQ